MIMDWEEYGTMENHWESDGRSWETPTFVLWQKSEFAIETG